ncbi:MAG TPA: hypothetical protein VF615_27140 [Longimicrobiaceae bacterium]|jgi:hypothetical protein
MTRNLRRALPALAAALLPCAALAQGAGTPAPAARTVGPPVQPITTASALSTEPLGSITGVRELPDGRVLVNDGTRRRLVLMDTTLKTVRVVLDSLAEITNTYGTRTGALIPYRADSTLFVDPASYAMLVLDPEARIARVRSVWRVQDLPSLSGQAVVGWPGMDARGRVVYRVPARAAPPRVPPPSGVPYFPPDPDSAFVVAVDLATRKQDTLGVLRIPKTAMKVRQTGEGRFFFDQVLNPLPASDDWAVLPDGAVAFVRARDYRVEYLNPDGSRTSSPKLPFDWQRMTDEGKQRMVDSIRTAQGRTATTEYVSSMIRWANQAKRPYPEGFAVPEGYRPPPGFGRDWKLPPGMTLPAGYVYACAPGEEPVVRTPPAGAEDAAPGARTVVVSGAPVSGTPVPGAPVSVSAVTGSPVPGAPGAPPQGLPSCIPAPNSAGGTPPPPTLRQVHVLPAAELPDYRPPIASGGSVRADLEGNLWIRTVPPRPTPGGPIYDVVSRQGELVSRFQLPQGYSLLGFGRGKTVYLSMRDASGIHLARVRLR